MIKKENKQEKENICKELDLLNLKQSKRQIKDAIFYHKVHSILGITTAILALIVSNPHFKIMLYIGCMICITGIHSSNSDMKFAMLQAQIAAKEFKLR